MCRAFAAFVLMLLPLFVHAAEAPPLTVQRGDHLVLIGNALAEREQYFGHLETLLHSRFPDKELVVRNLGWSADELKLRPRSLNFEDHGHTLFDHKPDILLAFFGFNESFAGPAGLPKFEQDLTEFVTQTLATKYNGKAPPRLALIAPIAFENVERSGLPDGTKANQNLQLYSEALRRVAAKYGVRFVDLFTPTKQLMSQAPRNLTFNGVHLTDHGYREVAPVLVQSLFGGEAAKPQGGDLYEKLRTEVLEKNLQFQYDHRAVNGYYIYGGRKQPFGVVNFPEEFQKLRKMIANRDRRIWAVAQGKPVPAVIDDSNTGDLKPIPTNFTGEIKVTPPSEALKAFTLPPGFEINLFASEVEFPELAKPCQMAFDAQGRLWVATIPSYPMYLPGTPVNDKILILEDTNNDGKADRCSVFADKLYLPIGIALADGGAYVSQQPNLVFLKDTDGDGKADKKCLLLHGFDSADSHHAISAFRWGPGGDLYMMEGTFHHSQVETPYGPTRLKNAGAFRYEPRTEKCDVFVSYSFANPWGICWDRWGQTFLADASPGANYFAAAFSGRVPYPVKHPTMKQFLVKEWRPTCGCEIVESRNFPDEMQGDYLLNNCIGFLGTLQYRFKEDGSGFAADPVPPLLRSSDPNFRPVDISFGPDGALYLCDWFNPLIGHMQHSIRDPKRDKTHGRIWRITYKNKPLVKKPVIADQPIAVLLDLLKEYESWTRQQARLELRRHDTAKVMTALEQWMGQLDRKDTQYEHHLLEALWVCQQHDAVNPKLLRQLLQTTDPRARAAATRVLCYWRDRIPDALELLRVQINDKHPRVRLEAVRALSFFAGPDAVAVAQQALSQPQDYYLQYTFRETMQALGAAANLAALHQTPRGKQAPVIRLLCQQAGADVLAQLFEMAQEGGSFTQEERLAVFEGLAEAAQVRRVKPEISQHVLQQMLLQEGREEPQLQATIIRLIGLWQVQALRRELEAVASASKRPEPVQQAALESLVQLGGKTSLPTLEKLLAADQPIRLRLRAAAALARLDTDAAARRTAEILSRSTDADDPAPVLMAFLDLKGGADKLAAALTKQPPAADVAKLALRHLNAAGRSDAALVQALSSAAGISLTTRTPSSEEIKQLVEDVQKKGNASRGELVFRRADLGCFKCHALNGAGGAIGPDLRDVGSVSPPDYLLRSILLPDEAIKEQYETVKVATADGRIFHGIVAEDTAQRLVLKDATGALRIVAKADVEDRAKGGSLMPSGLANFLTRSELVDLVRFLSELGKPGDFAVQLKPVFRRWRVLRTVPQPLTGEPDAATLRRELLAGDDSRWEAVYARINGDLPLSEVASRSGTSLVVQGEIEVAKAGIVSLQVTGPPGYRLWLDDQPIPTGPQPRLQVTQGRHRLTFKIDGKPGKSESLRVELLSAEPSGAQASVVGGP